MVGRKFLVAGDGGFNLTNEHDGAILGSQYTPQEFMQRYTDFFGSGDFRRWLQGIGIPTYVGSSGRVFPSKGIKPYQVLDAVKQRLDTNGTTVLTGYRWVETGRDQATFVVGDKQVSLKYDVVVYAMGGSSWPQTGSTGEWLAAFGDLGIHSAPWMASNCGWEVDCPADLLRSIEGMPLKNIAIAIDDMYIKGEVLMTSYGIEGSALYAVQQALRRYYAKLGYATVYLDLKPTMTTARVEQILASMGQITSRALRRKLKLSAPMVQLAKAIVSKEDYQSASTMAAYIKRLPLRLQAPRPIAEAISTVGGVAIAAVSPHLELLAVPRAYCIGEMLDWDAPTGGYLIQGCASMAAYLAHHLKGSDFA